MSASTKPVFINVEDALAAVRSAAWAGQIETCGHRGCEEHLGPGEKRIHTFLGGIGATWDLTGAEELIQRAEKIAWVRNIFDHELAVQADGKVYRFDARMPGEEVSHVGA